MNVGNSNLSKMNQQGQEVILGQGVFFSPPEDEAKDEAKVVLASEIGSSLRRPSPTSMATVQEETETETEITMEKVRASGELNMSKVRALGKSETDEETDMDDARTSEGEFESDSDQGRDPEGFKAIRTTTGDIASEEGMQKAMQAMHDDEIVLWIQFPCSGQHAWVQLDQQHLNRCERKEAQQALFSSLWEPLRLVAAECLWCGGERRE